MDMSMPKYIFSRNLAFDFQRPTNVFSLAVMLSFLLLSAHSFGADSLREAKLFAPRINVPSANITLRLGISKEITYSFSVDKPIILHLHVVGEVQKKVSGGFYGRPTIEVIQNDTGYIIPSWEYDIKFDDTYTSNNLRASYLINKGEYIIKLKGKINGWSRDINFDRDILALNLSTSTEDMVVPDWLPPINSWLSEIGLGDKISIVASSRGPNFRFSPVVIW